MRLNTIYIPPANGSNAVAITQHDLKNNIYLSCAGFKIFITHCSKNYFTQPYSGYIILGNELQDFRN